MPARARYPARRAATDSTAITFELAKYVLCVQWRPGPRIDRVDASGDGPPVDADLVQHEVIGRLGLDAPLSEIGGRKMRRQCAHDRPGQPTPEGHRPGCRTLVDARTYDRSARTRPAGEKFLWRLEREIDPYGRLPPARTSYGCGSPASGAAA